MIHFYKFICIREGKTNYLKKNELKQEELSKNLGRNIQFKVVTEDRIAEIYLNAFKLGNI